MKVEAIYISPGHNFFGFHGKTPGNHEVIPVPEVECVAGRGLRGDRFFDFRENYKGQVTFFDVEVYDDLCQKLQISDRPTSVFRRNVITRGVDLNSLVGAPFELQGICFEGVSECSPCYWMDRAFGIGAEACLKGRGGLRARIRTSGTLRVDAV